MVRLYVLLKLKSTDFADPVDDGHSFFSPMQPMQPMPPKSALDELNYRPHLCQVSGR